MLIEVDTDTDIIAEDILADVAKIFKNGNLFVSELSPQPETGVITLPAQKTSRFLNASENVKKEKSTTLGSFAEIIDAENAYRPLMADDERIRRDAWIMSGFASARNRI